MSMGVNGERRFCCALRLIPWGLDSITPDSSANVRLATTLRADTFVPELIIAGQMERNMQQ